MEAQRWRLGMFASCGWFWEDPVRTETDQVLRAAARAVRLVDGLRDPASSIASSRISATLQSPSTGIDGAAIYRKALVEIGQPPPAERHPTVR